MLIFDQILGAVCTQNAPSFLIGFEISTAYDPLNPPTRPTRGPSSLFIDPNDLAYPAKHDFKYKESALFTQVFL
jgi:hypothetical protein